MAINENKGLYYEIKKEPTNENIFFFFYERITRSYNKGKIKPYTR